MPEYRQKKINLTIYGKPVGKARPRVVRTRQGKSITYTPEKTRTAEEMWQWAWKASQQTPFPKGTPLAFTLFASFLEPKRGKNRRPISKPDLSNIIKLCEDALNGLAYYDDSSIVQIEAVKIYSDKPKVEIWIKEILEGEG